jgi:drug/metabolite transporter (DMT)-like permease
VVAAVLFGAATPLSKDLLGDLSAQVLAGLLYLGAFVAVAVALAARRASPEARLQRVDAPRLVALVFTGGVLAPLLLLLGLERIQGTTGSLLLNLEGIATLVIGLTLFGEHLSPRAWVGGAVVFLGAGLLALGTGDAEVDLVGIGLVASACACWGLDNNLTQSLSVRDPFRIVAVKTGAAAAVNLTIAVALGDQLPFSAVVLAALGIGTFSYGVSIVLDAYALRYLGAARESIVFATAPFLGALLSIPILGESLGARELIAGAAMAAGVGLVATERHRHWHVHESLTHDHVHVHDDHHQHPHEQGVSEPHSHAHTHEVLAHSHEHVSDSHHRHSHRRST